MRPDGIRVRGEDAMYELIPYFLTKRYDAMNMITVDIPMAPIHEYMNKKWAEGRQMTYLTVLLAAYVRMVQQFPSLNRFVGNRKIYEHKDFTVAMVVLRPGEDDNTISKIRFELTDDIFTVHQKLIEYITENRKDNNDNSLDKVMHTLLSVPGLMRFLIGIVWFLEKHNMLPRKLCDISPFHASVLISNLASIRSNHIYHHVYQFGSTSIALTIGNMREVPRQTRNGVVHDRCLPLGIVMDERICSGHYYIQAFNLLKALLKNPEKLEQPVTDD